MIIEFVGQGNMKLVSISVYMYFLHVYLVKVRLQRSLNLCSRNSYRFSMEFQNCELLYEKVARFMLLFVVIQYNFSN